MPQAGGDAVFDFLRVCRHGFQLKLGLVPPAPRPGAPGRQLRAVYQRIQAASPPPARGGLDWRFGIRVNDGTENGRPLGATDGDHSWKRQGVLHVEDIPSLDQPDPGTIVLDRWLAVPAAQASPTTFAFTNEVDQVGFVSASYPQPHVEDGDVTLVAVDYYGVYDIRWSRELPPDSWVAISFDRFFPPERRSVEFLAPVGDCDASG
jgi:hypothetical protein